MTGERILVVEDEEAIADALTYSLMREGFAVDVVSDGDVAMEIDPDGYALILLDVMLPQRSGYEVCRALRARSTVPVLMVTARTGESDRVLGLEVGADDYLGKPFSIPELLARVRALLRRREMDRRESGAIRAAGSLRLDVLSRTVTVNGASVALTPLEVQLLALFVDHVDRPVGRREVMEHLGRSGFTGGLRACDTHVKNLRQKIEIDPARPLRLVTVRGLGYMLRAV